MSCPFGTVSIIFYCFSLCTITTSAWTNNNNNYKNSLSFYNDCLSLCTQFEKTKQLKTWKSQLWNLNNNIKPEPEIPVDISLTGYFQTLIYILWCTSTNIFSKVTDLNSPRLHMHED